MGIKYIIEMEDKPFELLSEDGLTSEKLFRVKGFNSLVFDWNGLNMLTPYTEPDLEQVRKEAYDKCIDEAEMSAYKLYSPKIDKAYQRGLSDAWDAARKIIRMPEGDLLNLFTECYAAVCTSVQVFLKYDASECIEKIRAYEQRQEEINVGDEVVAEYGNAIVVGVTENCVRCMYSNGKHATLRKLDAVRTGRHFPEIAAVLEKMKES